MLLLPRFAEQPRQSTLQLSHELGVPPDLIIGDINSLIERIDDPPGYQDPVGVLIDGDTITVRTNHFLRPMRVTSAELCALELGLSVLQQGSDPQRAATIDALRQKLEACIVRLPNDDAYAGLRQGALTDGIGRSALEAVRQALRNNCVLEIEYQRPSDTEPGSRTVRPYQLVFSNGSWYLAAHCENSEAMRLFRVDRIVSAKLLKRTHEIPDDFAVESLLHDGHPFLMNRAPSRLVVRYSSAIARWIAERDGKPLEPDGSAVRSLPLADREWAIRHVLQYGPDAQIVEPAELRDELIGRLQGGV